MGCVMCAMRLCACDPRKFSALRTFAPTTTMSNSLTLAHSIRKLLAPAQTYARGYWKAGVFWGATATAALLYTFQPYAIWTRIPVLGRYYTDDIYEAQVEKKKKEKLAEIQAEYEKLHAEATGKKDE